jgi:hypothetical protein
MKIIYLKDFISENNFIKKFKYEHKINYKTDNIICENEKYYLIHKIDNFDIIYNIKCNNNIILLLNDNEYKLKNNIEDFIYFNSPYYDLKLKILLTNYDLKLSYEFIKLINHNFYQYLLSYVKIINNENMILYKGNYFINKQAKL